MIAAALAAAGHALGPDAGRVLARIAGPIGDEARALHCRRVASRERATWAAIARAPLPPGLRGIDPSWIEAALAGLPIAARAALAGGSGDPTSVWLARWACAELPAMPATVERTGPPRTIAEAVTLPAAALVAWLHAVGADQLAFALAIAGEGALEKLARSSAPLRAAATRIGEPPRRGALGLARAVIERCASGDVLEIGAHAIAPYVAAVPFAARQLALRLRRDRGLVIAQAFAASAAAPLANCPTWPALAAV